MKYKIDDKTYKLNIILQAILFLGIVLLCGILSYASFLMFSKQLLYVSIIIAVFMFGIVLFFMNMLIVVNIQEKNNEYIIGDESLTIHSKKDIVIAYNSIFSIASNKKEDKLFKIKISIHNNKYVITKLQNSGLEAIMQKVLEARGIDNESL